MESRHTGNRSAVSAAVRRYPQFELTIYRLIGTNESFRDVCDELAEAELALSKVDDLPPGLRVARRTEWQDTVDRLAAELKDAIEGRGSFLQSPGPSKRQR
jgi:hypothetical protein